MIRTQCIALATLIGLTTLGSTVTVASQEKPPDTPIGIEEKLGAFVPAELGFLDANGDSVYLGALIDKPTILTLVYYHCPTICKPLLSGVVEVVNKTDLTPGRDYTLLTISFDETDTPESAALIRTNFATAVERELAPDAWRFLTGDSVTIARLASAVGFGFQRREQDFAHATSLIVLSAEGKIVRYLYGLRYMPFDPRMAVLEATRGTPAPSIARVLEYCFSYDPEGRRYALNLNRVAGVGILLFAVGWVLYITSTGRRRGKVEG